MYCCLLSRRSSHPFSLLVKEEKNAQNLLIIKDRALGEKYIENWKDHARPSEIYEGRER